MLMINRKWPTISHSKLSGAATFVPWWQQVYLRYVGAGPALP
jgi:hypothetical protein